MTQEPAGGTTVATHGIGDKMVIYIVAGAMATGVAAWGVHDLLQSKIGPEYPAKPLATRELFH